MTSLKQDIIQLFVEALQQTFPEWGTLSPLVSATKDVSHGDFQCNVAMSLAKKVGKNPREVAERIRARAAELDAGSLVEDFQIAGPGFINVRVAKTALAQRLQSLLADSRLGVELISDSQLHVLDFSSPNLAKEMHIGHLRTTITGDVIARVLEFMGHPTKRVNHVGDWGTQFGMLLEYLYAEHPEAIAAPENFAVKDLQEFYQAAKKRFDEDPVFQEASRLRVVNLQSENPVEINLWKIFCAASLKHCHELYKILNVSLEDIGESFYRHRLAAVVDELLASGLAKLDAGAVCVFLDDHAAPFMIRKSDGGFNYATTDLAAMKYRVQELGAKRILIITDLRQTEHFKMLFSVARQTGWVGTDVQLAHIGYGMILGADKRPFKTRDGNTVRLKDVIDEAVLRARSVLDKNENNRVFPEAEKSEIARKVGLAAIKYFDLSHNLASDYVFDWETMLAMEGNTGPYMLYAYARIQSILRKAQVEDIPLPKQFILEHPSEIALAKVLLGFSDVVRDVAENFRPSSLTEFLYDVAKTFNTFYDKKSGVSVLEATPGDMRQTRLKLCEITARVLGKGLELLGIDTVERM